MYVFLMHENLVRHDWQDFRANPDNPRPDIETPDEWIAEAKAGNIVMLGAKVMIQNELPSLSLGESRATGVMTR